jgi:hypothetical protein
MRAVNLIPADQRSGGSPFAEASGGAAYVLVAVVLGLAVMAFMYGEADNEIGEKQAEANRLSAEASKASSEASRLAPYTSFVSLREERLKDVQQLANTRFDWAHAMHELGRVLPSDAALSSLTATIGSTSSSGGSVAAKATSAATAAASGSSAGASSVSSATPQGSTPVFNLGGCAGSQSGVAQVMNRLRLMDGVSDVNLQSSTKSGGSGGSGGSGASGASGGGCASGGATFAMTVTFDALPQPNVKTTPLTPSPTTSAANSGGTGQRKGVANR